jgi:hypothetical protein
MSRVSRLTDRLEHERPRHLTRIVAEHQCPVWPGNPQDKAVVQTCRSCMSTLEILHCCVSSEADWDSAGGILPLASCVGARLVQQSRGLPCGGDAAYQGRSRLSAFQLDGGGREQERGADGGSGERGKVVAEC